MTIGSLSPDSETRPAYAKQAMERAVAAIAKARGEV